MHILAIIYALGLITMLALGTVTMYYQTKYGNRKVDRYVKDLFTPNAVLMLRKLEE